MKLLLGGILAAITPKVVDSVGDSVGELWDEYFADEPKFTPEQISKIKECRSTLEVTDEHLTYQLNEHFKLNLKVEDYRNIW
jgi:hypothetical protein